MRKSFFYVCLYIILSTITYTAAHCQVMVQNSDGNHANVIEMDDGSYEFRMHISAKAMTTLICGRITSKTESITIEGTDYTIDRKDEKDEDGNRYFFEGVGYKNTTELRKGVREFVRVKLDIK